METFSVMLGKFMRRQGVNVTTLAEKTGVSWGGANNWTLPENRPPPPSRVMEIVRALSLTDEESTALQRAAMQERLPPEAASFLKSSVYEEAVSYESDAISPDVAKLLVAISTLQNDLSLLLEQIVRDSGIDVEGIVKQLESLHESLPVENKGA